MSSCFWLPYCTDSCSGNVWGDMTVMRLVACVSQATEIKNVKKLKKSTHSRQIRIKMCSIDSGFHINWRRIEIKPVSISSLKWEWLSYFGSVVLSTLRIAWSRKETSVATFVCPDSGVLGFHWTGCRVAPMYRVYPVGGYHQKSRWRVTEACTCFVIATIQGSKDSHMLLFCFLICIPKM